MSGPTGSQGADEDGRRRLQFPKAHRVGENYGATNTLAILEGSTLNRDAGLGVALYSGKVVSRPTDLRASLFSGDSLLSAKASGCAAVERQLELMVELASKLYNGINEVFVRMGTSGPTLRPLGRQHALRSDAGCGYSGLSGKPCVDCVFNNRFS